MAQTEGGWRRRAGLEPVRLFHSPALELDGDPPWGAPPETKAVGLGARARRQRCVI